MRSSRRQFIVQAASLGALAIASPALATLLPDRPRSVTLLIGGTSVDSSVIHGVSVGARMLSLGRIGQLRLSGQSGQDFETIRNWSMNAAGRGLFGLLTDASAFIVQEALRDVSARTICSGTHSLRSGVPARHHFVATPAADGINDALTSRLTALKGAASSILPSVIGEILLHLAAGDSIEGVAGRLVAGTSGSGDHAGEELNLSSLVAVI